MPKNLVWDEVKRAANLTKHGLDFAQSHWVLESNLRMDMESIRNGELRVQSFAYVMNKLAVLTVVHTERDQATRDISFRRASFEECEAYYEWLETD